MADTLATDGVAAASLTTNVVPNVMPTAVMGTNDNCTVSKRSVESLYYAKPHFYRYFVKKFKKRTALINRGYLLRMKAIEHELRTFLLQTTGRKAIINLGCGYDALPFRMICCFAELCHATTFVDVDYESLIQEKVAIIRQNAELSDLLKGTDISKQIKPVILRSDNYLAVGCDLSKPESLQDLLATEFGNEVSYFIISEVSITYMPVETADTLVSWMSQLKSARFCLLEQCLPNGSNHPFASTMLKHFQKLSSPLRVVQRYQTVESQQSRFQSYGWADVRARSLWDIWRHEEVFSSAERCNLRSIETFDEHEEFSLFAAHYFLLTANSTAHDTSTSSITRSLGDGFSVEEPNVSVSRLSPRRDGAIYEIQDQALVYYGGDDGRSRLATMQIYVDKHKPDAKIEVEQGTISPRKHHTITKLSSNNDCLLVGGRNSPEKALQDCWLRKNGRWTRVGDLPIPLFRHSAALVSEGNDNGSSGQSRVVVFGGKTQHDQDSNVWFLWSELEGWKTLSVKSGNVSPRFSASLLYLQDKAIGILLGGMISSEIVANDIFTWSIVDNEISIDKQDVADYSQSDQRPFRFGAVLLRYLDSLLLLGGIAKEGLPRAKPDDSGDILAFSLDFSQREGEKPLLKYVPCRSLITIPPIMRQPLLIGHSAIVQDDMVHIVGGGAICFSFGSFMNSTSWHIMQTDGKDFTICTGLLKELNNHTLHNSLTAAKQEDIKGELNHEDDRYQEYSKQSTTTGFIAVNRVVSDIKESLSKRVAKRKPCVFEGIDLGDCTRKWTPEYLKQALASERLFDIHHAKADVMLFESKNFEIRKESFSSFMDAVIAGEKKYLRAVSTKDKYKPANFYKDFETLAADFRLPRHLAISEDQQHSSVFRISGAINMWLHYDTLSNILCQIRGSKRLLLFAPSDVAHLKIPPGRSSSDLNVFDPRAWEKTSLKHTHPYEAILRPGDVLYIPPLWCHAALPLDTVSIAINTFFKTEDDQIYAQGKDTYGNKDIAEYEYARKDVAKAMDRFSSMPRDTQRFYLERLADEILQKARKKN